MNSKPIAVPFTRLQWISLLALAAAQFINILDFMIVMPLGPRFIEELKITPEQFGHLVASYGFAAFFGGMIASGVIDRYERKRAMLVIFGCFAFCTLMCGLASEYWILLFARGMTGVFGGIVGSMTMTMVSDLFPEGRRGFALGIVAGSFAIASVLGVPLALFVADKTQSVWTPFFILAGIACFVWILLLLALPTLRCHILSVPHSYWKTVGDQFRVPSHRLAYLYTVFLVFGTFTVAPYIATYMVSNVGMDKLEVKYIYIVGGICSLIAMPIIGRLTDRFGKLRMFMIFCSCAILPTLMITNSGALSLPLALIITSSYMTLTSGRMVPAQALLAAATTPRLRAGFMSVNSAVQHLSSGMAASLSASILDTDSEKGITGFPLVGGIAISSILISFPIAWILQRRSQSRLAS